jgi:hypothetical protein
MTTLKHTSYCSDVLSFDQVIQFYHFCIDHLIGKETELLVSGDREQTSQCTATRGATRHLNQFHCEMARKRLVRKGKMTPFIIEPTYLSLLTIGRYFVS